MKIKPELQGSALLLLYLRKEVLALSQQDLAKELKVTRAIISYFENAREPISRDLAMEFIKILDKCRSFTKNVK